MPARPLRRRKHGRSAKAKRKFCYTLAPSLPAALLVLQRCPLRVGTDFSGLDSPIIALIQMRLSFLHVFACDALPASQKLIKTIFRPKHFYGDAMTRDVDAMPKTDLFVSGFPCQPFSTGGKQLGVLDSRGLLADASLTYIECHKPQMVVLENVAGLMHAKHRPLLEHILNRLAILGYTISAELLNTASFKLPHHRKRLYIVGTMRGRTVCFPPPSTSSIALSDLLMPLRANTWRPTPTTKHGRRVVLMHYRKLVKQGVRIFDAPIVVDAGSSKKFSKASIGIASCLTKTRCSNKDGYWVSSKGGSLSKDEMMLLQGIDPSTFPESLRHRLGVSDCAFGGMLGNCMSVNVLCNLLPRVFLASIWATKAEALQLQHNSGW